MSSVLELCLETAPAPAESFRHVFEAMTTHCELQLYGLSPVAARDVAAAVEARVGALVRRYNFHSPASWLNRAVNERRHDRIELDAESAAVLSTVHEHAARTGGAFDITVGTLAGQLRRARSAEDVAAARRRLGPYVGLAHWRIEGQTLRFDNPYTRLDLGGVIKEHAVDVSARIARDAGASAGLVNYGGDVYAFGRKPDRQRFVVAVPSASDPKRMLFGLDLEDQALTTSAHYARQRTIRGGVLSHVVGADPDRATWISASVVSPSALLSGIYSTSLLIAGDIPLPGDVHAVVIDRHDQLHRLSAAGPTA